MLIAQPPFTVLDRNMSLNSHPLPKVVYLALALLAGCAVASDPQSLPVGTEPVAAPIGYYPLCYNQPNTSACEKPDKPLPSSQPPDSLDMQLSIQRVFDYSSDEDQHGIKEHWASYDSESVYREGFKGDCDDYALTYADSLIREGADPGDIALVFAQTRHTPTYHLTVLYRGKIYDNINKWPAYWDTLDYEYLKAMLFDSPGTWYEVSTKEMGDRSAVGYTGAISQRSDSD